MMWPRLEPLRDLLAEDGLIWVSIDDNEAYYLKIIMIIMIIMDEVFGRKSFVEYKGAHIADGADTAEKRAIRELWQRKSAGAAVQPCREKRQRRRMRVSS